MFYNNTSLKIKGVTMDLATLSMIKDKNSGESSGSGGGNDVTYYKIHAVNNTGSNYGIYFGIVSNDSFVFDDETIVPTRDSFIQKESEYLFVKGLVSNYQKDAYVMSPAKNGLSIITMCSITLWMKGQNDPGGFEIPVTTEEKGPANHKVYRVSRNDIASALETLGDDSVSEIVIYLSNYS